MTTEEWLIEQKEHATRALEAYQLLYKVYLDQYVVSESEWCIPGNLSEKVEEFFRANL